MHREQARYAWHMRAICFLIVLLAAATAAAQPVSYQLKGEVPIGEKPQIRVTAAQKVLDVRIELDRHDGKHFTLAHKALAKGQAVTLAVGDGSAGRASFRTPRARCRRTSRPSTRRRRCRCSSSPAGRSDR